MYEEIEFKDRELFLIIGEGFRHPMIVDSREEAVNYLAKGITTYDDGVNVNKCRVFTFPGLKEIIKTKIRILMQEAE